MSYRLKRKTKSTSRHRNQHNRNIVLVIEKSQPGPLCNVQSPDSRVTEKIKKTEAL